ncbi:MAG: hypothetical protein JWR81_1942 [Pseudonocardia sp.]|nr:hypothetical protein [Pseudonocardia sp.]
MSSRHSRAAVFVIIGRSSAATRRECSKPRRSEWAITASTTAVRSRPSGPGRSGVAWVSTTEPAPSPSTISIVIVRGSGQLNPAKTGTPRRLPTVNVTSTRKRSSPGGQWIGGAETTRNPANEYGCSQLPCHGSSRLAITSSGSQRPITVATAARLRSAGGRGPSTGASRRGPSARSSRRTQASTPSSWAGSVRQPGRPAAPRARPCQRQISCPPCTGALHSAAPRCGQAPGPTRSVPSSSRQATSSRPATTRPKTLPGRTSRLLAITNQPPDGRSSARSRAARMIPGLASAHEGRCCAQAGRRSLRSGLTGRSFTPARLGPVRDGGDPAGPRHNHWFLRKLRYSSPQITAMSRSTIG